MNLKFSFKGIHACFAGEIQLKTKKIPLVLGCFILSQGFALILINV